MNWLQRISQTSQDDLDYEKALSYFGIGHGDFNEDTGEEPTFHVWVYLAGRIKTGPLGYGESQPDLPSGGTHGSIWGHESCDRTYKGRFEPDTGRLSIVKPCDREHDPVPQAVLNALHGEFKISDITVF